MAPGGIADPFFLAVEDPFVAVPLGRGQHPAGSAAANKRFGQAEGADLLAFGHGRQPALFLFVRAAEVDRSHGQTAMDAEKGSERTVGAGDLHGQNAGKQSASTRTAEPLKAGAHNPEFGEIRHDFEWEGIRLPMFVGNGIDPGLHEGAHFGQFIAFCFRKVFLQPVKIRVRQRQACQF